jgi:hypothetical protein
MTALCAPLGEVCEGTTSAMNLLSPHRKVIALELQQNYFLGLICPKVSQIFIRYFKSFCNEQNGRTCKRADDYSAANAPLKLSLGQLLDTAATFGTFIRVAWLGF